MAEASDKHRDTSQGSLTSVQPAETVRKYISLRSRKHKDGLAPSPLKVTQLSAAVCRCSSPLGAATVKHAGLKLEHWTNIIATFPIWIENAIFAPTHPLIANTCYIVLYYTELYCNMQLCLLRCLISYTVAKQGS